MPSTKQSMPVAWRCDRCSCTFPAQPRQLLGPPEHLCKAAPFRRRALVAVEEGE